MSPSARSQHNTYATHQRGDEPARETEARALLSCASRLETACKGEKPSDDYDDAIKHNQKLWTIFQGCLTEKENTLPTELKTLLLNLSVYVDKVSFQALTEYNPVQVTGLIEINRNIAAGLSANTAGVAPGMPTSDQASMVRTMA